MMGSAFFGLNIGQQGLYTAKTALNITSHNIANANTEGYSRQYGVQEATRPLPSGPQGMIGTGSEINNIKQHRDAYLDYKYWSMTNELGEFETKSEILSQLELIFNEPSDNGYSTFFNDIFESLQTLSKTPGETTARSALVDTMESFASYVNDIGEQVTDLQREANFGIKTSVDQINFYAQQLATLNYQIGNLELTGKAANDLRDERNRLIDGLSTVINVDADELTDVNGKQTFRVSINGQILVDNASANYLKVVPRETLNNPEDTLDLYDVYWKSGKELYLDNNKISGELKGYIDLRDGNNGENFKGTILSGQGTSTLVFSNPSRTDIPQVGELNMNGVLMRYNSYTYDDVLDQITFELGPTIAVDGQQGSTQDIYGNDFAGTISFDSSTQVRLTNVSNQDLPPAGTINLDGTVVTYTGYSKDPVIPNEITLTIEAPATVNGSTAYVGDQMTFRGIPYYIDQLNEFVRTIAREFNAINESGNGGTGTQIFTFEGYTAPPALDTTVPSSYERMTIHNFIVNPDLVADVSLFENTVTPNGGESANDLILQLIDKRHDVNMFEKGEPDNFMQSLIGELGIDTKQVESFRVGQVSLLNLVNNQRLSVSGVDLNEETTNLVKFQQAYDVAAKIISVMDEIYDTTINRMGV